MLEIIICIKGQLHKLLLLDGMISSNKMKGDSHIPGYILLYVLVLSLLFALSLYLGLLT